MVNQEEENRLKDYYNQRIYAYGMPEYKDIEGDHKEAIRNSLGFAFFNLNSALDKAKESIKKTLHLN